MANFSIVECNVPSKRRRVSKENELLSQPHSKKTLPRLTLTTGENTCTIRSRLNAALPPATNAQHTVALWHRVWQRKAMEETAPSWARPTEASQHKRNPRPQPQSNSRPQRKAASALIPTPPASYDLDDLASVSDVTRSTGISQADSQPSRKTPRVTDKNFRSLTLRRHGIDVHEDASSLDMEGPYRHFGVRSAPEGGKKEEAVNWYHIQHGQEDSTIWLPLDKEDASLVAHEYEQMVAAEEEEAKFAFYGKVAFFRQDIAHKPASPKRKRTTYCKMEWAPKPDEKNHLRCPPVVQDDAHGVASAKQFCFENKPDLTFWLPLLLFNSAYRDLVNRFTFVVPKAEVTAPYFTVQFKKDDEDLEAAVNQLAAAAALVLYNRVFLRAYRLLKYGHTASWSSSHFNGIVHYGVAFAADVAYIYKVMPRDPPDSTPDSNSQPGPSTAWAGCTLYCLLRIQISSADKVLELRAWINEIQNWGLGTYAEDFLLDIKGILWMAKGGREKVSLAESEIRMLAIA